MVRKKIIEEIERQRLPENYASSVDRYFMPLADKIANLHMHQNRTVMIGVQGGQGTGKSTLAVFISLILQKKHKLNCVVLSLDDFYLTKSERKVLAETVHPLLKTRGVPGTHDTHLALKIIDQLKALKNNDKVSIPRFDKAQDDRKLKSEWDTVTDCVDVILLEGWCVGVEPQSEDCLVCPINELEEQNDVSGEWRRWVNEQLRLGYKTLFDQLDYLITLQAPSFDVIFEWRLLQEQKLKERSSQVKGLSAGVMNDDEIAYFIQHYERITQQCFDTLPEKADCVFKLNEEHQIEKMTEVPL